MLLQHIMSAEQWTHHPLYKMAAISQTTFTNVFLWMKILHFDSNFYEVYS